MKLMEIKDIREKLDLSQEDMAKLLGLKSKQQVSNRELYKTICKPSEMITLCKLAKVQPSSVRWE